MLVRSQTAQGGSELRIFHHLDQQPIFDAAVRSFFDPPIAAKNLFFAIEWFAMDATYNEVRLVNAMTALENLIDSNLEEDAALIQNKSAYEKTRKVLRSVIRTCLAKWSPHGAIEALAELNEKLADLARRSLLRKLTILAARWQVPLDGIPDASIRAAKQARDRVVHRGQYYQDARTDDPDLWAHVTIVREIVVRFLLAIIGYNGRYSSYVGGCLVAEFPPRALGGN